MDTNPKILVWNLSDEEMRLFGLFLKDIDGPRLEQIRRDQGHLLVREILFTDKVSSDEFDSNEKVVLFYNVQAEMVQKVVAGIRESEDLPRPIFAVVTQHSIDWKFSHLVEELVKERDYFKAHKGAQPDDH
ncbi:MAG: hypothetical protein DRG37_05835 [Deltaproteobacteria bacterium]|nr:MAG: hypothetical protein DRG37_05835 [Deltaproteobacteria bacterium]